MREAWFHEDDYCRVELLPEANWDFCVQQMRDLKEFGEAHWTGCGWSKMLESPMLPAH
jgi:hypothetical protein